MMRLSIVIFFAGVPPIIQLEPDMVIPLMDINHGQAADVRFCMDALQRPTASDGVYKINLPGPDQPPLWGTG